MVKEFLFKEDNDEINGQVSRDATPLPSPSAPKEENSEEGSEKSSEENPEEGSGKNSEANSEASPDKNAEENSDDANQSTNPEESLKEISETSSAETESITEQPVPTGEPSPQSPDSSDIIQIVIICILSVLLLGLACFTFLKMKIFGRTSEADDQKGGDDEVKMIKSHGDSHVKIYSIHGVGNREMQQDSFGISDVANMNVLNEKGFLAVVADGMGGLADGNKVSQNVVVSMLEGFDESPASEIPSSKLLKLVVDANDSSMKLIGEDNAGKSGSTVVATLIKDNCLSWISVGDSHIYAYRDGKLAKLNHDHNYGAELDIQVARGEMSVEEAMSNPQRNALSSYIGMGNLELVDQSEQPIKLRKGDRILLMSDGVFGTLGDELICKLMNRPIKEASMAINYEILKMNNPKQDNYTCILIEII